MNAFPIASLVLAVVALGCVRDEWKYVAPRDGGSEAAAPSCEAGASCADAGVDAGAEVDAPCVGAACTCSPSQMYCEDRCVEGPTAAYAGEGSADDGAGDRHAVRVQVAYAAGRRGRAFSFGGDRNPSYVELPSDLGDFGDGDFTISLWFNSGYTDGNQSMIARRLACWDAPAYSGYDVRLAYTGRVHVELWTTVRQYILDSPTGFNDLRWHHVAIVREGLQARLVVDGAVGETGAVAHDFQGSMNDPHHTPTYLGVGRCVASAPGTNGRSDGTRWFEGLLDEVAFFPRAMTEGELAATVQGRCSR